jgi:translocation and assembly module TamB
MRFRTLVSRIALAAVGLALLGAIGVWLERKNIARRFAQAELDARKVKATFEITKIGPRTERIENIIVGDPARPDLTARWAEVELSTGLSGVAIKSVRAGGVRLRGRLVEGVLSFGEADKLLPKPDGTPFALPDMVVSLADVRLGLETPWGAVGARIDGKGNLSDGFAGKLAAVMPQVAVGGATASGTSAYLGVSVASRRISLKGPVRAASAERGAIKSQAISLMLDGVVGEGFDHVDGNLVVDVAALKLPSATIGKAHSEARIGWQNGRITADGKISALGAVPEPDQLERLAAQLRAANATPIGPIGEALGTAVRGLNQGATLTGIFSLEGDPARGTAVFSQLGAVSASGAQLRQSPISRVRIGWPEGAALVDGSFTLAGGGFPNAQIALKGGANALSGTGIIGPMSEAGTRLTLSPVRFAYGRKGLDVSTIAALDGAIGGGQVRGLTAPLSLRGGRLALGCLPVGFQSYAIQSLMLAPTKVSICVNGKQATIAAPRLAGRLGDSPFALAARSAQVGIADGRFSLDTLALRLGEAGALSALDLLRIEGRFADGVGNGTLTDARGNIGNVPLLISKGQGAWRYVNGVATLEGGVQIADAAKEARYLPVRGDRLTLRLADGRISGETMLTAPTTGTPLARVTLEHILATGKGHADLDVAGLTFGRALQPEMLTPITLGVIANVEGKVSGRGRINWTKDGVTSTGGFSTEGLDLAAAFGPVTGLKGEIALSDLLGLETPAGQRVTIGSINPGIAVTEGEVRYRLLPDLKMQVEGGHWPFAGGELILEPTILDLNHAATRRLTFRVIGLDSALFVQQMAFENIAVTGKFDGVLPMVFDEQGGRIVGGELVVRKGGGTLSYVGDVTNAELGRFSRLAFDALKSIKYRNLRLELNGALDGEMVTSVRFDGVNQLPLTRSKNFFLKQFNAIPFIFNINIRAPFRGLFSTVRSFNDPSMFLPNVLSPKLQPVEPVQPKPPVQP